MLQKKIGKLRSAAEQFRHDAERASAHTNFKQAVISMDACVLELQCLLQRGLASHSHQQGPSTSAAATDGG
jgi:hypothetical protein